MKIQGFWESNKDRLVLINTLAYSLELNPQENIWNLLKNKIFNIGARENIEMLFDGIAALYDQFNEDKELIKSIVYVRNYCYEL